MTLDNSNKIPKGSFFWLILAVVILENYGNNFTYDQPQLLSDQLIISMNVTQIQLNLFYSIMAITNIFLAPSLPFLIEYLGLEVVNFCAIASIFFGSTITTIGMGYSSYFVLLVGRFFGGFGMELGYISAFTIMERHFKSNNLTIVNSLVAASILSASAVSNFSTIRIFKKTRTIFIPSFLGSIICFVCTLLALSYYFIVYYFERAEALALEKESKLAEDSELCKKYLKN